MLKCYFFLLGRECEHEHECESEVNADVDMDMENYRIDELGSNFHELSIAHQKYYKSSRLLNKKVLKHHKKI